MCEGIKSCIKGFAKVILIAINTIALLAGILMIGVGIFTIAKGKDYIPDVGVSINPAAIAIIVLGSCLLFIGCFGCFGACTGKHGLLNFYLILLGIILLLEIIVLVYGFVNRAKVEGTIKEHITKPFNDINEGGEDADDLIIVTSVQRMTKCCGLDGPDFWTNAKFGGQVPGSCCEGVEDDQNCDKSAAYTDGCLGTSTDLVRQTLSLVIVVLIAIALFQVVCMILACCSKQDYENISA